MKAYVRLVIRYGKPVRKLVVYEVEVRAKEVVLLPALLFEYAEITNFEGSFWIESVSSDRQGNAKKVNIPALMDDIEKERYWCYFMKTAPNENANPVTETHEDDQQKKESVGRETILENILKKLQETNSSESQKEIKSTESPGGACAKVQRNRHSYLDNQTKRKLNELSEQSGRSIPNIIRQCAEKNDTLSPSPAHRHRRLLHHTVILDITF